MSKAVDYLSYFFKWNALSDACPTCRSLNGKEYVNQDIYQEYLWDPIWGNIWDFWADNSMAHGQERYNCRCQLAVRVEFDITKWSGYEALTNLIETGEKL